MERWILIYSENGRDCEIPLLLILKVNMQKAKLFKLH